MTSKHSRSALLVVAITVASSSGCEKIRSLREARAGGGRATTGTTSAAGAFAFDNTRATQRAMDSIGPHQQRLVVTTRSTAGRETRAVHTRLFIGAEQVRHELETVDADGRPVRSMVARTGRAVYLRDGDQRCSGALSADAAVEPFVLPLSLLPSLHDAAAAGVESIGTEAARRYNFDQSALRTRSAARAQGSIWIAVNGGWVVRYSLRASDASGERVWEYTAARVAAQADVRPPECGAVVEDIPAIAGATLEERASGSLSYEAARSLTDVRAFIGQSMAPLGYTQRVVLRETSEAFFLLFDQRATSRLALVSAEHERGTTRVHLQIADPPSAAAIASAQAAAAQRPQPAPTLAPAVAALARFLPDRLGDAPAIDPPNGTSTNMFGMRATMAMRNYQSSAGRVQVMLTRGDIVRMARSNIASGPSDRQRAAGSRNTTLAGLPAAITIDGERATLQCVLDNDVLLDVQLNGPGAAGADRVQSLAEALDLAAIRRAR